MGCYKSLLLSAGEGDKEAILAVAEFFRRRQEYNKAIFWYGKIKKSKEISKKIAEVREILAMIHDEDIFQM